MQDKSTENLFDDWAERGRAEGMERGHFPRAVQALEAMPIRSGQHLLDLGCGNGWSARWMAARGGAETRVAGVDAAPRMVARARELSEDAAGVEFHCSHFEALPFPDSSFHHAFSMEALYYSQDLPAALGEVRRVLRPGGTLTFCTDFFEENPHCHGWPEQMGIPMLLLSERGWREALEAAGLQVEASFRCLDPRPPDPAQSEQEQQATLHFRTEVGSLTLRARRDDETPSS